MSSLPADERDSLLLNLSPAQRRLLEHWWPFWARPEQLPPDGDWSTWVISAGRGFGKTRTGAEIVNALAAAGAVARIGLIGATAADVRDVMVTGESGIMETAMPDVRPVYQPSLRRIVWPNGVIATTYSAAEPDRLRGPQHDFIWYDEIAAWKKPETLKLARLGLRLQPPVPKLTGPSWLRRRRPWAIATTTPKRREFLRQLYAAKSTVITRGTTYDNAANLADTFIEDVVSEYAGTRLGAQEIEGELLNDVDGAYWKLDTIAAHRVDESEVPELVRVIVAVDPAATARASSDETGIAVVGLGIDQHFYVLMIDGCRLDPTGWARRVIGLFRRFNASLIVAERNQGGDMVKTTIRTEWPDAPVHVTFSTQSKETYAEPVSLMYEQGKVHHVGTFAVGEDQMCSFPIDKSEHDDRVDAVVSAIRNLKSNSGSLLLFGESD